ncbi:hypothetical protein COLO4_31418 [Corchorus olitorius]|uniref:Pentacotripeptide-repeat region of PRORP domain-containing protein n=1 Tax=Corchorus olitorius TaxID=93759 RepID=A0A1R3H4I5_9ROSI|nr:hypothetical protein COLO4_31418 [Corchorus olitorius]
MMGTKVAFKWSRNITPSQVVHLIKKERNIDKALAIFDSATAEYANGFRHDQNTFGFMISRLVSANKFGPAEDLLDRMRVEKCDIKEDVFLSICRGYGRVHRPLDAIKVFDKMKEFQCEPSQKSYITVFDILVEENQLKVAFRFYRHMRDILDRMKLQGLQPDAGLYGKIISGFCDIDKFREAANFLDEMVLGRTLPNRLTWSIHVRIHNMVVQGLCTKSDLSQAFQLYLSMRTRGISVEVETFHTLMKSFCKKGDLQKAARIVDEMVADGCTPEEGSWTILLGAFWDQRMVQEALEVFQAELMSEFTEADVEMHVKSL